MTSDVPNYGPDFYDGVQATAGASAAVVVPMLIDLLSPDSVVDIGCGTAAWAGAFADCGVTDVFGVDGGDVQLDALRIPPKRFSRQDLTQPLTLGRRFDVALCLEVAEHLPPESADTLIRSLVDAAPVVIFSAAVPYQGGTHHLNEQWPDYWYQRFASHGYVAADPLRRKLFGDPRVAWWYAQNLVVYLTAERAAAHDRLAPEIGAPAGFVHPIRFLQWIDYARAAADWSW